MRKETRPYHIKGSEHTDQKMHRMIATVFSSYSYYSRHHRLTWVLTKAREENRAKYSKTTPSQH